jgi:hypothetical protein
MMATDLGPILTDSLRARAGHDIDPAPIMRAAVVKGARIRRRRRAATAAVAVVAVLGLAAVAVRLPRADTDPPVVPLLAEPALRLPSADGQPGAADRPDLVGADPTVLHFDVDGITAGAHDVVWSVGKGTEQADIFGDDRRVFVGLARTADGLPGPVVPSILNPLTPPVAVEIGGRPGIVRSTERTPAGAEGLGFWLVQWQPNDGFWAVAQVWTAARDDALAVAAAVRFDSARRCAVPFRMTSLAAGTVLQRCEVSLSGETGTAFRQGVLEFAVGERELSIRANLPNSMGEPLPKGTLAAGPYRAGRLSARAWNMMAGPYVVVVIASTSARYTEQDVLTELGGLQTVGDPDDPASW